MNRFRIWLLEHKHEVILGVLIFLISFLSFGLGYLAAGENQRAPIIIQKVTP